MKGLQVTFTVHWRLVTVQTFANHPHVPHAQSTHFRLFIHFFLILSLTVSCFCAVLRGLDLILPRGTITAVVGRSGAGKSTVASLISRFYEPDSGAVWLGGRPASEFTRGEWAKAVALVSQEPVLFSGIRLVWTNA